jgi:hypothetical protein
MRIKLKHKVGMLQTSKVPKENFNVIKKIIKKIKISSSCHKIVQMQKKIETKRESFDKAFNDKTSIKFYKVHHTRLYKRATWKVVTLG